MEREERRRATTRFLMFRETLIARSPVSAKNAPALIFLLAY